MRPKEVVQKNYDCFLTGDMDTSRTLYAENDVVKAMEFINYLELNMAQILDGCTGSNAESIRRI